jgi:phospholipase C
MQDADGNLIGLYSGLCSVQWTGSCSGSEYVSGIPYGNQTEEDALFFEDGFKGVRGYLTEGRYLVFESNGYALSNPHSCKKQLRTSPATADHASISQRWVLHALAAEGTTFNISSALDDMYISQNQTLSATDTGAETLNVTYIGGSQYIMQMEDGKYMNIQPDGSISFDSKSIPYNVYSVTYHS